MDNNLKKFNLVFDIGANVGNTVVYLLSRSQKIVCFEPIPSLAEHLKKYFKNQNVEVVQKGLAKTIEQKDFHISNMGGVLSTFSDSWRNDSRFSNSGKWDEVIKVETTTLDTVIEEYGTPDFIKIDVEGYEYEVIQGLTKLLDNTLFAFEWAEEAFDTAEKVVSYAKELGYNNFAYTYGDELWKLDSLQFTEWSKLSIHENISPMRKTVWGMIYFKK